MRNTRNWWVEFVPSDLYGSDGSDDDDTKSQVDDDKNSDDDNDDDDDDDGNPDKVSPEYIAKLRKESAAKRIKAKEANARAEKAEAELAEIKKSEMTDLEKAATELKDSTSELDSEKKLRLAAESDLKSERINNAVTLAAVDEGFVDPKDALSMVSQDDLVDDDGEIDEKSVKTSLKNLAKKKPYLLKKNSKGTGDGGGSGKTDDSSPEAKQKQYLEQMTAGGRIVVG